MIDDDNQAATSDLRKYEWFDTLQDIVKHKSIFNIIYDNRHVSLDEIASNAGCSKSTANRAVNKFASAGLIEKHKQGRNHTYTVTFLGRQLMDWIAEGHEILDQRQLYTAFSANVSLPRWLCSQGSVEVAAEAGVSTHQVFDQIIHFIERVDHIRIVIPTLTNDTVFYRLSDEILTTDTTIEMILSQQLMETLRIRFSDKMERICSNDENGVFELPSEEDVPYGFIIGHKHDTETDTRDGEVAIVCYGDQFYRVTGTVINQTPRAVEWAHDRYTRYRKTATDRTADIVQNNYSGSLDSFSFDGEN